MPSVAFPRRGRGRGKSQRTQQLIASAYEILEQIQPASVRAVCYRLFTAGFIEDMSKAETNKVSTQLTWAREAGIIPWTWIVDERREVERVSAWENPSAYVEAVKRSYRRDRWADQPQRLEVWSEKGTVRGTLAPILDKYGIAFRVMHGYGSATAIHQAAEDSRTGRKLLQVLYLGDWDPSGLHMSSADIPARIKEYGGIVHLQRLALTAQDIRRTDLPSFSVETKKNDPRYAWFRRTYGDRCWELDALSPVVLRHRVEQAILDRLDMEAWGRAEIVERAETESLASILNSWPGISGHAQKYSAGAPDGE